MHNGEANWDGTTTMAANVKWEVGFASSPMDLLPVEFGISPNHHAVDAAKELTKKWNDAHPNHPAERTGVTVDFQPTQHGDEDIVGMWFTVGKGERKRVPANGTEVEVVKGLFVYRSRHIDQHLEEGEEGG